MGDCTAKPILLTCNGSCDLVKCTKMRIFNFFTFLNIIQVHTIGKPCTANMTQWYVQYILQYTPYMFDMERIQSWQMIVACMPLYMKPIGSATNKLDKEK